MCRNEPRRLPVTGPQEQHQREVVVGGVGCHLQHSPGGRLDEDVSRASPRLRLASWDSTVWLATGAIPASR